MKINITKKATSIVEAMIIMLIITTGVTGMYKIYSESMKLSNSTTNKLQAIQIASQGIEAFTNIRDTNWILFSSDYKNCWNTLNYNPDCIGRTSSSGDTKTNIKNNTSYIVYRDSSNRWVLEEKSTGTGDYKNTTYRNNFRVFLDTNNIYNQDPSGTQTDLVFTRELNVNYDSGDADQDQKLTLKSIVQRSDSSSTEPHKVEVEQILTNWKK